MAFKKGKSGNATGRPKGATDKKNADLKLWVKSLLEKNQEQFETDLLNLEPDKRLNILTALLKYAVPTLSSISVESQIQIEYQELQKLLEATPEIYLEKITEKILTLKSKTNESN